MTSVRVYAPAKVNLTLHITGQREDGYHLIDSLVAFAGRMGDGITVLPANTLSLTVEGPEAAGVPADMKNLALQAADMFVTSSGAALTLEKHLPTASGIGGGSADAAAAYRAMLCLEQNGRVPADQLWAAPDELLQLHAAALKSLGADVPMCFASTTARVQGIGDKVKHVSLPMLPAVLVNPRVPVSTPEIFARLSSKNNASMGEVPHTQDAAELIAWLTHQRNDLEAPAIAVAPVIADVLSALRNTTSCGLARMSGSGATCFGLYLTADEARAAAADIQTRHPSWWVAATPLSDQFERIIPRLGDKL